MRPGEVSTGGLLVRGALSGSEGAFLGQSEEQISDITHSADGHGGVWTKRPGLEASGVLRGAFGAFRLDGFGGDVPQRSWKSLTWNHEK